MEIDYFFVHIFTYCLVLVYGVDNSKQNTEKSPLRYGFQRTKECQDFQRAFLCVRKCLDLHYDIAHADKNCVCTCFFRKDKAKYTPVIFGQSTKWRLGAPTTSVPAWAHQQNLKLSGQDSLELNHEIGSLSGENAGVANGTVIELDQPTESGVAATGVEGNSTVVEGVTGTDDGNTGGDTAGSDPADAAPTTVDAAS